MKAIIFYKLKSRWAQAKQGDFILLPDPYNAHVYKGRPLDIEEFNSVVNDLLLKSDQFPARLQVRLIGEELESSELEMEAELEDLRKENDELLEINRALRDQLAERKTKAKKQPDEVAETQSNPEELQQAEGDESGASLDDLDDLDDADETDKPKKGKAK